MGSWADDMDRAMQQHPEQFGMVLDEELNPVDRRETPVNDYMNGTSGKRLLVAAIVLGLLVILTGAYRVAL